MLLIDGAHQSGGWRQDLIDEDENGLFWGELDTLADNVYKLTDGEIAGNEILLLIDSGDVGFLDLLADDGDAVVVFLTLDGKVSRLVNGVQCNKSVWGGLGHTMVMVGKGR